MKYKVVNESKLGFLENKVQDLINAGWKLQGGVSCSISESDTFYYPEYCQALILDEEEGVV